MAKFQVCKVVSLDGVWEVCWARKEPGRMVRALFERTCSSGDVVDIVVRVIVGEKLLDGFDGCLEAGIVGGFGDAGDSDIDVEEVAKLARLLEGDVKTLGADVGAGRVCGCGAIGNHQLGDSQAGFLVVETSEPQVDVLCFVERAEDLIADVIAEVLESAVCPDAGFGRKRLKQDLEIGVLGVARVEYGHAVVGGVVDSVQKLDGGRLEVHEALLSVVENWDGAGFRG